MLTTENAILLCSSFAILTVVWVIMAVYVFSEVRKTYARNALFRNNHKLDAAVFLPAFFGCIRCQRLGFPQSLRLNSILLNSFRD